MQKLEQIKRIISNFHESDSPKLQPRMLDVPLDLGKIAVIVGPRRAGKTYLLFQLMQRLRAQGVDRRDILYLNFEDERLDLQGDYDRILDAWQQLYPERSVDNLYIFFDEIQALGDWQRYVRRLYDSVSKRIFITGSNAKLLSQEIATALRGRCLSFELLPLSFGEFLQFLGIDAHARHSDRGRARVAAAFDRYLLWGGFPELVNIDERFRPAVLQEYFNVMMFLDIAERYGLRDTGLLRYVIKRLLSSFSKEYSVNKLYRDLKSQGHAVGKDSLYQMVEQIFSVFMLVSVDKYKPSLLRRNMSNKKVYLIDNGFASVVNFVQSEDRGKLLENMVYTHLREPGAEIFFAKNGWECDFVSLAPHRAPLLVQVTQKLSRDNLARELKGFAKAREQHPQAQCLLVYEARDVEIGEPAAYVQLVSIVDWLLQDAGPDSRRGSMPTMP